jgi:serine/threonine protein kinase
VSSEYKSTEIPNEVSTIGTIAFHAPEIYKNKIKGYNPIKSDVWAAGLIFYFMLLGKYPLEVKKKELFID